MDVDAFIEAVLFPAFNANDDIESADMVMPSFAQSGAVYEVVMTDGSAFRITVNPVPDGMRHPSSSDEGTG